MFCFSFIPLPHPLSLTSVTLSPPSNTLLLSPSSDSLLYCSSKTPFSYLSYRFPSLQHSFALSPSLYLTLCCFSPYRSQNKFEMYKIIIIVAAGVRGILIITLTSVAIVKCHMKKKRLVRDIEAINKMNQVKDPNTKIKVKGVKSKEEKKAEKDGGKKRKKFFKSKWQNGRLCPIFHLRVNIPPLTLHRFFVSYSLSSQLSVCVCLSLSVSVCVCLSLSVSVCVCLSLSVSVCLCLSLSVSVCVCLSLSLSVCYPISFPIVVSVCVCLLSYFIPYSSLCLCLSVILFHSL